MKKTTLSTITLLIILLAGAIAAYFYFQNEQPKLEPTTAVTEEVKLPTVVTDDVEPAPRQVLDALSEELTLPPLETSDDFMAKALANLLNNKTLMAVFSNNQLISNIVVTIDNLPRKEISMRKMPIKKALGKFLTMENEGQEFISPDNQARYAQYMKVAKAIDPQQLVTLYVQLYPLFQQSYQALGYPDQYFNDRLMLTIDNLLATPEIDEPVALIKPKIFYLYADSALENRSIGQRILMRIGNDNQRIVKAKLEGIKQALMLHMHEEKIE
jgi:hypothetical protein